MSTLKDIKKLVIENPDDSDLGAKVRQYAKEQITCCDKLENVVNFLDKDSHPYGWWIIGTKCQSCGKILTMTFDK